MSLLLAPEIAARVRHNEPMSRHTSWHAGGPADLYFEPANRAELAQFLQGLPDDMTVHWVGLGSNLLVRDAGLRGAVIVMHEFDVLERRPDTLVSCEAGVPCARLARQCIKWGLGPAEFFAGIPGTLGGALAMNAGAFGGETWRHVVQVEVIDRTGTLRARPAAAYDVGYRRVASPAPFEGFVSAVLRFEPKPGAHQDEIRRLLSQRKATQPIGEWNCGSVFTNPPGDHAARLIESAGLKGYRIGDASVSGKHANFIINHGKASAADLEGLITHVRRVVKAHHGVELHPEVRIVGDAQ